MVLERIIGAAVASSVASIVTGAATIIEANKSKQQVVYNTNNYYNYNPQPERKYIYCEYCGSEIELTPGVSTCCHCGAPLRINPNTRQNPNYQGQNYNNSFGQRQQNPFYSFTCYRCGTKVRYTKANIIRSPGANRAVSAAGFRGHTGEVRCVKCGTLLPHFETNLDNSW